METNKDFKPTKKKICLDKREAKLIFEVLDEGMPTSPRKRDEIAKIWFKLMEFSKK